MRKGATYINWKRLSLALMVSAMITTLLIGTSAQSIQTNDQGGSGEGAQDRKLQGTWNVTLRFPVCSASCPCPGGVPNIPIPTLNTYLKDGTMLVTLGGSF